MLLPGLAIVVGAITGLGAGGRFGALGDLRFRAMPLLAVGLGGQLALGWTPEPWRPVLLMATYATVGWWLLSNCRSRPRPMLIALCTLAAGWALNLAAIAPNAGMPVSRHALDQAGAPDGFAVEDGNLFKHIPASGSTVLRPLGDVIPVAPLGAAISAGDILLFAGTVGAVALAMTGRATEPRT